MCVRCQYEKLIGTKEIVSVVNGLCVSNRTTRTDHTTGNDSCADGYYCYCYSVCRVPFPMPRNLLLGTSIHDIDQPCHNLLAARQRQTVELGTFQCYLRALGADNFVHVPYTVPVMSIRPNIIQVRLSVKILELRYRIKVTARPVKKKISSAEKIQSRFTQ